jgi:hypothetical protein
MRTYYNGDTYTVAFTEEDTSCFARYTDAAPDDVCGRGTFVFNTVSGDLMKVTGSGAGHQESMGWLAFSQDAQDQAREELSRHGVNVNPYDFCCDMPEVTDQSGVRKHKGAKPEIGRSVIMLNPGTCPTRVVPDEEGCIVNIDDRGALHIEWENGSSSALAQDDDWMLPPAWNPPPSISRTRGVKKMKGPFSKAKGYKGWIQRRGKLGEGFLTTMSTEERHKALDRCCTDFGYRSCLDSILVLERARKGPRGKCEGVGVRYATKLKESREYLKMKYGGPGSFKSEESGHDYFGNPEAEEHKARAHSCLREGEEALRRAVELYSSGGGGTRPPLGGQEIEAACAYARDSYQLGAHALHEIGNSAIADEQAEHFREAAKQMQAASTTLLDKMGCAWTGRGR